MSVQRCVPGACGVVTRVTKELVLYLSAADYLLPSQISTKDDYVVSDLKMGRKKAGSLHLLSFLSTQTCSVFPPQQMSHPNNATGCIVP